MASIVKKDDSSYLITVYLGRDYKEKRLFRRTVFHPTSSSEMKKQKEVERFTLIFEEKIKNDGFRRGEMIALTWKDIDFEKRTVSITKNAVKTKQGIVIKDRKTRAGNRTVTLPSVCFHVLEKWQYEQKKLRLKFGQDWKGSKESFEDNSIFIQDDGSMMHLDTPLRRFRQIVQSYNRQIENDAQKISNPDMRKAKLAEKLPEIRLHDLRHTSATLLIAEGTDIETVAHRLGHNDPSVTLNVYGHALPAKDKEAADTLARVLG